MSSVESFHILIVCKAVEDLLKCSLLSSIILNRLDCQHILHETVEIANALVTRLRDLDGKCTANKIFKVSELKLPLKVEKDLGDLVNDHHLL